MRIIEASEAKAVLSAHWTETEATPHQRRQDTDALHSFFTVVVGNGVRLQYAGNNRYSIVER